MRIKRLLAFALAFSICFIVNAATLEEIISSAKENSPSFKNTQIAYQDGLLGLRQMEKEDETIITIGGTVNPYEELAIRSGTKKGFTITPSINVEFPDSDTTLSANMGYSMSYDGKLMEYSPEISASHLFDFSGYDSDTLKDLNYAISSLETEVAYSNGEYSFEKTVISTISTLLTALKSLDATNKNVNDLQTNLDNLDKLGSVTKDSTAYKNVLYALNVAQNSKIALEKQYEDAKANYKIFTGLDWNGVDTLSEPILELRVIEGGNSTVILKSLEVDKAQLEYDNLKAEQNPNGLDLSGGVSGEYEYMSVSDFDTKTGALGLNAGISYTANNWTLSASHNSTWNFDKNDSTTYSPSITLSGAWTNGTISSSGTARQSTRDELELQLKQNEVLTANNEYIAALTAYTQEGQDLYVRILKWNFDKSEKQNNLEYLKAVLDNQQALFNRGLVPQSDVDSAAFDLKQAEYDWQIMLLDGLSLERDLRIFAL